MKIEDTDFLEESSSNICTTNALTPMGTPFKYLPYKILTDTSCHKYGYDLNMTVRSFLRMVISYTCLTRRQTPMKRVKSIPRRTWTTDRVFVIIRGRLDIATAREMAPVKSLKSSSSQRECKTIFVPLCSGSTQSNGWNSSR